MTDDLETVAVIVPAYDAARTLGGVIGGIRLSLPSAAIVVVDDGSADDTSRVAAAARVGIIRFARNRGKGAALRAGFGAARGRRASRIVTLDADGQHDPAVLPAMLAALADNDIVVGTRARPGSTMPWPRRVTNQLSTAACSVLAGCAVHDAQSGFRAIRSEVLDRVAARGDRFEFETDFLIRAGRAGMRIGAVPIPTIYGRTSHFRPGPDAARVVWTILRHRVGAAG
ncbi:MAG: glycosyltransferase family 2 protein [Gemmatimonadaceae bacterium]